MKKIFENKKLLIGIIIVGLFLFWYSHKDIVTKPTGNMVSPHSHHQAILLKDGRVFITSPAEIYNPKTGKFTAVEDIDGDFVMSSAILLSDGRILLGGSAIYDPQNKTFLRLNHIFDIQRSFETKALLPNGKVVFTGSDYPPNNVCKNSKMQFCKENLFKVEIYDAKFNKFFLADSINPKMVNHQSVLLKNGKLLFTGNNIVKGPEDIANLSCYAEVYDYKTNKFEKINNNYNAKFNTRIYPLLNGNALIIGSPNFQGKQPIVEIYDAKLNKFRQIKNMNIPRILPTIVTLKDNKLLILGGTKWAGAHELLQSEIFDPEKETFELSGKMNLFGWFNEERGGYSATLVPSGKVLLAGGSIGYGEFARVVDDIEIYDPKTGIFTKKKMRTPRIGHSATLLNDGRVLIAGGRDRHDQVLNSAEIYEDK